MASAASMSEAGVFCVLQSSLNPMGHYAYFHLIDGETEGQKLLDLPESQ